MVVIFIVVNATRCEGVGGSRGGIDTRVGGAGSRPESSGESVIVGGDGEDEGV